MIQASHEQFPKEEILKLFKICEDIRLKERYHAILLSYDGYNPPQIAEILYRDETTVREWIRSFNKEGLEGKANIA